MPRDRFDRSLDKLQNQLAEMGNLVDGIIRDTIKTIKTNDYDLAQKISQGDYVINELEHGIEQSCMFLIAQQQPLARDLRIITSTLKVITDIERIADQCVDIASIIERHEGLDAFKDLPKIKLLFMFENARSMYVRSVDAYMEMDEEKARRVCEDDDIVDAEFTSLVLEISSILAQKPELASPAVDYLMMVKYIERMADHATNIGEWAIFRLTGEHHDLSNITHDDPIDQS